MITKFKKDNPNWEKLTGDPEDGNFTEKEVLLLEICQLEKEHARAQDKEKSEADQRRDRHEQKLMCAAKNSRKKRKLQEQEKDDEPNTDDEYNAGTSLQKPTGSALKPTKGRKNWQSAIAGYFSDKREEKLADRKLEESKLEIEREKLRLEEKRLELETQKLYQAARDREALYENNRMLGQMVTRFTEKNTG
ncbi:uncharacterized protein LOC129582781 [Paramacrobiotus metropolitanus]|uniref:uncharacterized protein LOC129582781 n=1 Tax=Paramacrobiotus metropolitanus TaxID=2943436 RepID=UPI002445E0AC|nr:uncharacterized protein LOC129582781 [Paramacrobiotus metropolitanus]